MEIIRSFSLVIHVLSVFAWFLGALLTFVAQTSTRYKNFLHEPRDKLLRGLRWNFLFPLIAISGYYNAYAMTGSLSPIRWMEDHLEISVKLYLFLFIVSLTAFHDFSFAHNVKSESGAVEMKDENEAKNEKKEGRWLMGANIALGLVAIFLGLRM